MSERDEYITILRKKINKGIQRDVLSCLKGINERDSIEFLGVGRRYSPQAIRLLILTSLGIVSAAEGDSYRVPNQQQFSQNLLLYGYSMGFISKLERKILDRGLPILWKLSKDEQDAAIGYHPESPVMMAGSVASLAEKVNIERKMNPELKFVLYHGKWNVPHIGHLSFIHDSFSKIAEEYSITPRLLRGLVVGEKNSYIESVGKWVYMNTDWRLSLMSYIPGLFCVAPGGDIDIDNAQGYWTEQYLAIRPDFLPVEIGDTMSERKKENALGLGMGIRIVEVPSSLMVGEKQSISSTVLSNGTLDDGIFQEACDSFKQSVGDSWRRKWF